LSNNCKKEHVMNQSRKPDSRKRFGNTSRRDFLKTSAAAGAAGMLACSFPGLVLARQPGGPYPDKFRQIHNGLIVIDGTVPLISVSKNPEHFDWFIQGGATAIGVSAAGLNYEQDMTTSIMAWFAEQIQTRPDLVLIRSAEDIRKAKRDGKLGIYYHFQGPSPLGQDLDRVWYYKQSGVGVIQLAYNTRNPYANGITERVDGGLSLLGQRLVKACNEARVIVDVAHTGARSALDAIEASSEPVILSHGNALGKINNGRNVPDEVLRAVAQNGGFAGAVGYPPFVSEKKQPTMDDMVGMVDYMVELMGIDHVAFGIDYDNTQHGVMSDEDATAMYDAYVASGAWDPAAYPEPPYYYPEGIELPKTLYNLTGALLARGYTENDVAKLWGGNWLRVMDQVWGDPHAHVIDDEPIGIHQH
jgi:membrane dipeptidase